MGAPSAPVPRAKQQSLRRCPSSSKMLGILHIGSCGAPANLLLRFCSVRLIGKWANHNHHVAGREAAELRREIVECAHSTTVGGTASPPDTRRDHCRSAIRLA